MNPSKIVILRENNAVLFRVLDAVILLLHVGRVPANGAMLTATRLEEPRNREHRGPERPPQRAPWPIE